MTTRKGFCLGCSVIITIEYIRADLDKSRFYWSSIIVCPICSSEITMKVEP